MSKFMNLTIATPWACWPYIRVGLPLMPTGGSLCEPTGPYFYYGVT